MHRFEHRHAAILGFNIALHCNSLVPRTSSTWKLYNIATIFDMQVPENASTLQRSSTLRCPKNIATIFNTQVPEKNKQNILQQSGARKNVSNNRPCTISTIHAGAQRSIQVIAANDRRMHHLLLGIQSSLCRWLFMESELELTVGADEASRPQDFFTITGAHPSTRTHVCQGIRTNRRCSMIRA